MVLLKWRRSFTHWRTTVVHWFRRRIWFWWVLPIIVSLSTSALFFRPSKSYCFSSLLYAPHNFSVLLEYPFSQSPLTLLSISHLPYSSSLWPQPYLPVVSLCISLTTIVCFTLWDNITITKTMHPFFFFCFLQWHHFQFHILKKKLKFPLYIYKEVNCMSFKLEFRFILLKNFIPFL